MSQYDAVGAKLLATIQQKGGAPQTILEETRRWLEEQRYGEKEFFAQFMRKRRRFSGWGNIQPHIS